MEGTFLPLLIAYNFQVSSVYLSWHWSLAFEANVLVFVYVYHEFFAFQKTSVAQILILLGGLLARTFENYLDSKTHSDLRK